MTTENQNKETEAARNYAENEILKRPNLDLDTKIWVSGALQIGFGKGIEWYKQQPLQGLPDKENIMSCISSNLYNIRNHLGQPMLDTFKCDEISEFIYMDIKSLFESTPAPVEGDKSVCHVCDKKQNELYECERCGELYCDDCSSTYNQFTQIDYNCCKPCSEQRF